MADAGSRSVRNLFSTRRRRVVAIVVVVLVAAGLATLASGLGQRLLGSEGEPGPGLPPGFTEFRSPQGGFAVSYPEGWTREQTADPQVVLVATQGSAVSLQIRVVELDVAIGPRELPAVRQALTDQIAMSNESLELLVGPQQIELAGLPGYYYFYTFQDSGSGLRGAHSHFFVFNGQRLITLVFQTLPTEQFPAAAPTFDQITASFRRLEE